MLTFDKLKLVTKPLYISSIQNNIFSTIIRNGEIEGHIYKQTEPYQLLINVNYMKNELVIEFTSKILKDDCISLINIDNIEQCLNNINKLGICKINIEDIIYDSTVVKCDVTKDFEINLQIKEICTQIRKSIKNYEKWKLKRYNKEGISIEKVAKTPKYKRRIIIYDKRKELMKVTNRKFLNSLKNRNRFFDYFKDKIRFEVNINSMAQMREMLNIENNSLSNVLNSEANPIFDLLSNIIDPKIKSYHSTMWKDYLKELVLKDNDFDLEKLEAKIRSMIPATTSVKRTLEPYREFLERLKEMNNNIDILALVA